MRRTHTLFLFGLLLGTAALAQTAGPGEARTAAIRLVRAMNLRPLVEEVIDQSVPSGEAREIARLLLADDKTFWEVYESEVAALYEKRFSTEELRQLAEFFDSNLGRKWTASQPDLLKYQRTVLQTGRGSLMKVQELGCSTALLGPNFVKAKERSGHPEMAVPADFLTRFAPIVATVRSLCSCMLKEAVKKWGPDALAVHSQEETGRLLQESIESGACPLPNLEPQK